MFGRDSGEVADLRYWRGASFETHLDKVCWHRRFRELRILAMHSVLYLSPASSAPVMYRVPLPLGSESCGTMSRRCRDRRRRSMHGRKSCRRLRRQLAVALSVRRGSKGSQKVRLTKSAITIATLPVLHHTFIGSLAGARSVKRQAAVVGAGETRPRAGQSGGAGVAVRRRGLKRSKSRDWR